MLAPLAKCSRWPAAVFKAQGGINVVDFIQFAHNSVVVMPALKLPLTFGNTLFVQTDLAEGDIQKAAEVSQFRAIERFVGALVQSDGSAQDFDTSLTQDATQ